MSKKIRIGIGLVISAFCLWFVFRGFDFDILKNSLRNASYGWFFLSVVLFIFNMTLRACRWKTLLSPLKEINLKEIFPILMLGFMMNIILPARGGEVVRSVALAKKSSLPTSSLLGSVVAERLSDLLGLLMVILIASKLLPLEKLPVAGIGAAVLIGIIGCVGFVRFAKTSHKWNMDASTWKGKLFLLFSRMTEGFLALQSPSKIFIVIGLSCFIWLNELVISYIISRALHFDLSFLESAGLLTGLSVGVMIPAAPGYIGTFEFFGKSVLEMMGKPSSESLGFVVVLHFSHVTMTFFVGLLSLLCANILKGTNKSNAS